MIIVRLASGTPIYRQIIDQVKSLVGGGVLRPGDRLPSIRELAVQLTVNPLTVQKAYDALADEGVLTKEPGRGVFIAEHAAGTYSRAEREARLRPLLDAAAAEAARLGITPARAIRLFTDAVETLDRQDPNL